jgi:hypothetical protein
MLTDCRSESLAAVKPGSFLTRAIQPAYAWNHRNLDCRGNTRWLNQVFAGLHPAPPLPTIQAIGRSKRKKYGRFET